MGLEIERKFLVLDESWRDGADAGETLRQAYLSNGPLTLRVRIASERDAWLTIKAARSERTRAEYEYAIPLADAEDLMEMRTGGVVAKRRHRHPAGGGLVWEIDVFSGDHAGLVLAEIELPSENTAFAHPAWLGEEVTGDGRYANAALASSGTIGGSRSPG